MADDDGWLLQGSADVDDVRDYYDRWAAAYDDDLDGWEYRAPDVVAAKLLALTGADVAVLDAGCGTGRVGAALRSAGQRGPLHGIDVSPASLELADATGAYDSVAEADLQQPLRFDDDAFGGLVCVGVMTYVPDVERCWREFARVVAPGGAVVVTQRHDLWDERGCAEVIRRLASDGVWAPVEVTTPQPYLPGNTDFADAVGVHYVVAQTV